MDPELGDHLRIRAEYKGTRSGRDFKHRKTLDSRSELTNLFDKFLQHRMISDSACLADHVAKKFGDAKKSYLSIVCSRLINNFASNDSSDDDRQSDEDSSRDRDPGHDTIELEPPFRHLALVELVRRHSTM